MLKYSSQFLVGGLLSLSVASASVLPPTSEIVGTWQFVEEVNLRADGSVAEFPGQGAYDGLLIYAPDGFMSVTMMPKGRRWTIADATTAQLRETIEVGTAYAGRYDVNPTTHTVTHIVAVILDPEVQEKRLVRDYSIKGKTLELSGTWPYQGETLRFTLKWVRAT
jgi:hypothetical protein